MSQSGQVAGRALGFVGVWAALTVLSYADGERYTAAWLPFLLIETSWLLPEGFAADSIALVKRKDERLIVIDARTSLVIYPRGVLPADKTYELTTLQAYALAHPVLIFAILATWPVGGSLRRRIALLLVGIPCVMITTSLDIPFVLAGLARGFVLGAFEPERIKSDPLVLYYAFLHRGGRYGLIVAATLFATIIGSRPSSHAAQSADHDSRGSADT